MIRAHTVTLWKDEQLWEKGFLADPGGTITLYASHEYPTGTEFTAATLPAGVKVCVNLTLSLVFAPRKAQDEAEEAARRYGYNLFEVDIVPW